MKYRGYIITAERTAYNRHEVNENHTIGNFISESMGEVTGMYITKNGDEEFLENADVVDAMAYIDEILDELNLNDQPES